MIKTERKLFIIKLITEPNNGLPTEINSLRVERGFKKATLKKNK
jgi:hypothetical protein